MTVLAIVRHNKVVVKKFATVTEAYNHYVKYYATFGEWFYYLRCAHTLLNRVHDEDIMECLFRNCFYSACITSERGI
jgi:hypothetical protein